MSTRTQEENVALAVVAMLCGGSALGWMFWQNGSAMFTQWYIYPSAFVFISIGLYLFVRLTHRHAVILWQLVKWWSGVWAIVFFLSFIAPPFSQLIVGSLTEPMLKLA